MPRGRPKSLRPEGMKVPSAALEILASKTPVAQGERVAGTLSAVEAFQQKLEGELDATFEKVKGLRDGEFDKASAPGAKVNLAAAALMMEHTHALHPERGGGKGEPVTLNVLIQMLCKPKAKR